MMRKAGKSAMVSRRLLSLQPLLQHQKRPQNVAVVSSTRNMLTPHVTHWPGAQDAELFDQLLRNQIICPELQRSPQPGINRNSEALLGPLN
jgi:hypothetical protein